MNALAYSARKKFYDIGARCHCHKKFLFATNAAVKHNKLEYLYLKRVFRIDSYLSVKPEWSLIWHPTIWVGFGQALGRLWAGFG